MSAPEQRQRVVVVGQGYVGLPVAMRAVAVGHDVVGLEVDAARAEQLAGGTSYVEDVSDEEVRAALASGRYRATASTADARGFDVAVITVPTPLREGSPDLSSIEQASRDLAEHLRAGATVILESTTYPGTTEELVAPLLERATGLVAGTDFHLGYSPERIDPGNPTWNLVNTPKVISGVGPASLAAVRGFYDTLVDTTVPVSSPKEAELTKLLENTFRHVNIALVYELAMFANDLGIDVWRPSTPPPPSRSATCASRRGRASAATACRSTRRISRGGCGGGSSMPFRFVELATDVNDHMSNYVTRRLVSAMNTRRKAMNGSHFLLVGLTYKANTSDARESPAMAVAERILDRGGEIRAVDSHVIPSQVDERVHLVPLTAAEVRMTDADAPVILTDHDDVDYSVVADQAQYVLDTRRRRTG